MEINPIGVHYALGHRCLAREERFEIGNVFTLKLVIFWKILRPTLNFTSGEIRGGGIGGLGQG